MNMRPTFPSILLLLFTLLFASTAAATNAGPRLPPPVKNASVQPVNERDRVMEILFEASCVRQHISKAYETKSDVARLLAKHGFDEQRIKDLVKRYLRLRDFKAELKIREAQCTSTLARTLYASN